MDNRSGSASNSSKSYAIGPHLSFGPDGCQALTSQGRRCGEMKTLQIIQEFKNMYETKMKQIDSEAGGDCVQAKFNLQQDWIRDLTEQNDMLVRVVEELELEAADRVTMLEEKLQQTSKCACEVMESYSDFSHTLLEDFQKMDRMQSDVHNLLELIKRAKHEGAWNFDDLEFYGFDLEEVLNEKNYTQNFSVDNNNVITDQRDKLLKQKNKKIKELEEKLANLVRGGEAEDAFQFKNLTQQYSDLKKSMKDMREALTAEVANKHDTILSLRRDVQLLEEQCRKADQQTHFKDDIIKELRKEIKQLKQQQQKKVPDDVIKRITQLEEENQALKESVEIAKRELLDLQHRTEQYLKERDGYMVKHRESLEVIETLQKENNITRERLKVLQEEKDESIDSFHSALITELEEYEKKHRESVEKIDKLRIELDKTKVDHKSSVDQIIILNNENRYQSQRIEALQAELMLKSQKPKTNTVSITASVSSRNFASNTSPSTNDKAINNIPTTRIIATSMDRHDNQITAMKASVGVEASPGEVCPPTCISDVSYFEATAIPRASKSRSPSPKIQQLTVTEVSTPSRSKSPSPSRSQDKSRKTRKQKPPGEGVILYSGSEIDEALGHVSAKYVEVTELSDSSPKKQSSTKGKGTATLTARYTPDFEVEGLPSFKNKFDAVDYLNLMGPKLFEAVELESSQDDPRIPGGNLMGTSSSEEIQQIVQIEILDKVMTAHPEQYATYSTGMLCPFGTSDGNKSSSYSPRSPVQFQPLSWEGSSNSESSMSSSSGTHLTRPTTATSTSVKVDGSKLKSAIKRRPRSRSTSSATDDLQSVVNDLNESVSRMMMKSPNEKASRQKIAQLEEQLRGVNKKINLIRNKDEMIKVQSETLNIIQIELQALKQKEHEVEVERKRRGQEVENLKLTIKEMERALNNSQEKSQNLQKAVDLNLNTVNLLETSEEHLKTEVAQQRVTIVNLQDALVSSKHQLEELRQKYSQEAQDSYNMMNILMINLQNAEEQCVHYNNQSINASSTVEYLRDVNLDLEVENFELTQDLLLFESRLLKYQQITKIKEESEGTSLEQENAALTSVVRELEVFVQSLQDQLGITEADLIREKKINQIQADRIEELQNIIGGKNIDINRYSDAYQDVKSKLDAAVSKNRTLQESIKELQEQFNEVEMQKMIQGETEEICHGELDICLNSLQEVKFKLRTQYQQLVQKIQECKDLEADLKIQTNNAEIYKKDLENTRIRYRDEAIELKRIIRELKEKLQISENKIDVLNEEIKDSQAMLLESAQREVKSQQEIAGREQELSEKIHSSQAEEMRLLELVGQLEQQLLTMRNEILMRDQQLEATKTNVHKIRSDYSKQANELNAAQEEVNVLKNELNTVIQKQGKLKADNEKLQEQVARLKNNIQLFDRRDQALTERLEAATSEINMLQSEKQLLQDKNEQISGEMVCLKDVLQKKTETAVNLEMELMQARANRKELCAESRNVVASVRAWLDEQRMINEHLKEKLQRKNSLIAKLQKEKEPTGSCVRSVCPAASSLKQRTDSLSTQYYSPTNHPRNWSLGSRGSGSQSPASSNESGQPDWYATYGETEYITPLADASPQRWIHRVESMTQELQRSNRYWKKKMNENEYTVTKDE